MRAISYVNIQDSINAGTMFGHNWRREEYLISELRVFDDEVRRLASVVPVAECMAGECAYTSWFQADFNVYDQLLVLTYGKWDDGHYYWNLQRNDADVDGPEGIHDLKKSKYFGPVLKYIKEYIRCADFIENYKKK